MAILKPDFEEVPPVKMIPISLKLNPTVLENMEAVRERIKQNRNAYINLAIDAFNHYQRYKMVKGQRNGYTKNLSNAYVWGVGTYSILINQVYTLNAETLVKKVGELNEEELKKMRRNIALVMGFII